VRRAAISNREESRQPSKRGGIGCCGEFPIACLRDLLMVDTFDEVERLLTYGNLVWKDIS
jgi:hypothetical protein